MNENEQKDMNTPQEPSGQPYETDGEHTPAQGESQTAQGFSVPVQDASRYGYFPQQPQVPPPQVPVEPYSEYGYPPNGGYPPQGPYHYVPVKKAPKPKKPKQGDPAVKILLIIIAAILEMVIVGFAVFGIYSMCTTTRTVVQPPSYSQQQGGAQPDNGTSSRTTKARLGLTCKEVVSKDQTIKGLMVISIDADSKAKDTEIQQGDVMVQINGRDVQDMDDYYDMMEDKNVGDVVELTMVRIDASSEKKEYKVKIELVERTEDNSTQGGIFPES